MTRLGRYFWIPFSLALLLKLLVTVTYPLNVSGDGANYLKMIATGWSSLLHAPGYPFLVGAPLFLRRLLVTGHAILPPDRPPPTDSEGAANAPSTEDEPRGARAGQRVLLAYYVYAMNHAIAALALLCLFLLARAIFSPAPGALAVLLYGLNPWAQTWSTMSRPEQAQGDLLIITLYLAYRARAEDGLNRKRAWYAAAAAVFALGFLVKFNGLPFAVVLGASLLFERGTPGERLVNAAAALGAATAVILIFVVGYQLPVTGSWRLNSGRGIYYLYPLRNDFGRLVGPENGMASKLYLALARLLPPNVPYCCANFFTRVDWVPAEQRRPYLERYGALLQSRDPLLIDQLYETAKRSPAPPTEEPSFFPLYYYLGLAEADRLLQEVYLETVRTHPAVFAHMILSNTLNGFVVRYDPVVPLAHDRMVFDLRPETGWVIPVGLGFVRLKDNAPTSRVFGYKHAAFFWMPGVQIVSRLSQAFAAVPPFAIWTLIAVGIAAALRRPLSDPIASRAAPALLLVGVVLFFLVSGILIEPRPKELRLIQPVLDLLTAVGCFDAWKILVSASARARPTLTRTGDRGRA